ncbi:MAG: M48 family metallopeptidase [Vampirovibrio sp.]|nr:M48 family metallopeptidase [Vampirovibrio sp.]
MKKNWRTSLEEQLRPLAVKITEKPKLRRANARHKHGEIHVSIPLRWPVTEKVDATKTLVQRVWAHVEKEASVLSDLPEASTVTLNTPALISDYVASLNAETFKAPLKRVRIGRARYTRLAQVNLKTGVMTISKYCLSDVPEAALRYLVIHELAHFYEPSHDSHFWGLVAQFVPNYQQQSKIIKAFHRMKVDEDAQVKAANPTLVETPKLPKSSTPSVLERLQLKLFS